MKGLPDTRTVAEGARMMQTILSLHLASEAVCVTLNTPSSSFRKCPSCSFPSVPGSMCPWQSQQVLTRQEYSFFLRPQGLSCALPGGPWSTPDVKLPSIFQTAVASFRDSPFYCTNPGISAYPQNVGCKPSSYTNL